MQPGIFVYYLFYLLHAQFEELMAILKEILDHIERHRRSKMLSETPDPQALEMR